MENLGLLLRRAILVQTVERLDSQIDREMNRSVQSVRSDLVRYYVTSADVDGVSFYAEHFEHGLSREYTVSVSNGTPDDDVEYEKYSTTGEWVDGGYCQYRRLQKTVREWIERLVALNAELAKAEAELNEVDEALAYIELTSEETEEVEGELNTAKREAPKVTARRPLRNGNESVTILWKGKTATVKYYGAPNLYTATASTYLQYTQLEIDILLEMLNSWEYIE